jgi:transcriptional regulator with XRE-family HTH domain
MKPIQITDKKTVRNMKVGRIIRAERLYRRMTGDELGTVIGCNYSTLSQYESGTRRLTPEKRDLLAAFLKEHQPSPGSGWPPFDDDRLLDPDAA